jgi:hypothetical protein
MSTLDQLSRQTYGALLCRKGFRYGGGNQLTRRFWVRSSKAPVIELFELSGHFGGLAQLGKWGFAMEFVPVFDRGRFRARRDSDSVFDLYISQVLTAGRVPKEYSFQWDLQHGAQPGEVLPVAKRSVAAAFRDFDRVHALRHLDELFRERCGNGRRSSFESVVRHYLAWAFLRKALGDESGAELKLRRFLRKHDVSGPDEQAVRNALRKVEPIKRRSEA